MTVAADTAVVALLGSAGPTAAARSSGSVPRPVGHQLQAPSGALGKATGDGQPQPGAGSAAGAGGIPVVEPLEDQLLVRRRHPGPVVHDVEDDLALDDRRPAARRANGRGPGRCRAGSEPPAELTGVGPDLAGRHVCGVDVGVPGAAVPAPPPRAPPRRGRAAEVTAGAPSSAAASTSRSSTSRSISPVAPSTSSRSTWASTAPGAARASSNETRWVVRGPCRSCETSATSRRCRCTEASTRDSIRFMVAARRPTSSRRPSSAIRRSSWLWPIASTSARMWSSLDRARPRTSQITRASATRTSGPPTIRVRRSALVASWTASRLEPTDDGHLAVGRLAVLDPDPVGLGLVVVRGPDGAPLHLRPRRDRRSAALPSMFADAARTVPSAAIDLRHAVVVHVAQHRWQLAGRRPGRAGRATRDRDSSSLLSVRCRSRVVHDQDAVPPRAPPRTAAWPAPWPWPAH